MVFLTFFHHNVPFSYLSSTTITIKTVAMASIGKSFMNIIAPKLDQEQLQAGFASITWAKKSHRTSDYSLTPSIPRINPDRPSGIPRIEQIQQDHSEPERRRRAASPSDAEISKFLRKTRPKVQKSHTTSQSRDNDLVVQKVGSRRILSCTNQGFQNLQSSHIVHEMAGTRRTGYLDAAAANIPRITPHQVFLKDQVKRQQDATDEWARRTGKPAPPYQFEDFIGKGAYGRVFKA